MQYDFEACDNDPVDSITIEHESVAQTMGQEVRRWATRVLRETSLVREATRKMHVYQAMRDAGQKVSSYQYFFTFAEKEFIKWIAESFAQQWDSTGKGKKSHAEEEEEEKTLISTPQVHTVVLRKKKTKFKRKLM